MMFFFNIRCKIVCVGYIYIIYGSRDSAQELYTAAMSFGSFVDWTQNPTMFIAETGVDHVPLSPYVLLTTRHQVDKATPTEKAAGKENRGDGGEEEAGDGSDEEAGDIAVGTSPNGKLMAKGGVLLDLLEVSVDDMFQSVGIGRRANSTSNNSTIYRDDPIVDRRTEAWHGRIDDGSWKEAWTSLRLGGAYTYPTHIDCFENILLQVSLILSFSFFFAVFLLFSIAVMWRRRSSYASLTHSLSCSLSFSLSLLFTLFDIINVQSRHIHLKLAGHKKVRFLPPFTVPQVRPDPNRKHWPGASPQELEKAFLQHGIIIIVSHSNLKSCPLSRKF